MKDRLDRIVADSVYIALSSFLLLALLELAVRLFPGAASNAVERRVGTESYSYYNWTEAYFRDAKLVKARGDFLTYAPYFLWQNVDVDTETINVRDGYRVTWAPEPHVGPPQETIFVLGGSTAFGSEVPDEFTLPSYIAKRLNASPAGSRYLVKNYSSSGFVIDNELHLLVELLAEGERPAAVLLYDGFNDTYNKVARGQPHHLYANFTAIVTGYHWRDALAAIAAKSKLISLFSAEEEKSPYVQQESVLRTNAQAMLENYRERLDLVRGLGSEFGFSVFSFWQPDIFSTRKALTPEEIAVKARSTDLEPAFDVTRVLIAETGFLASAGIIDVTAALDGVAESIFLDSCHVTAIGNDAIAAAMLASIPPPTSWATDSE